MLVSFLILFLAALIGSGTLVFKPTHPEYKKSLKVFSTLEKKELKTCTGRVILPQLGYDHLLTPFRACSLDERFNYMSLGA
ncbi:MAG: hypothetical protein CME60_10905 [Halobacteriovoraceae bacterium]|nr:hypothetical protein [Halobacteriovoraceae bacterium]|tara:strand:- start:449 stop:691 length:243 start_codon:yes stop_codon:yes gene_type:complete